MSATAAPIDPLAPAAVGVYRDEVVEVRATGLPRTRRSLHTVRTRHFDVTTEGERVLVGHVLAPEEIDDDLAGLLASELFGPGWLRGSELFERIFTGVVLTSGPEPLSAWEGFYANTLRRVDDPGAAVAADARGAAAGGGVIAQYAPVYHHAETLLRGRSVLDLGCSFGFLALRLARSGRTVCAVDVSAGTVGLLGRVAERMRAPLRTRVADAARVPEPDAAHDTVLALHLLEHLEAPHGARVLTEALRLAARRVVVAVPLEEVADETWGHVRTVDLADLDRWGRGAVGSGAARAIEVHEHHGGWLVLDR